MISERRILGHTFHHNSGEHGSDGSGSSVIEPTDSIYDSSQVQPGYYPTPNFSESDRFNPDAPFNLAPSYIFPRGYALPIARNFDYNSFIKTNWVNNTETNKPGDDLPLYIDLPNRPVDGSFQWDSFPAGEAQQFLTFSVSSDVINNQELINGDPDSNSPVILDALSSSNTERPFTISLSVTPYNAGPIPHIHWAEDEWFIILQGEMDSWIGDPLDDAYELFEFPAGSEPSSEYYSGPSITSKNVKDFYYGHLTAGQSVYLPRGHAHAYRNASANGDPLVFMTIWSRTPGYPEGGIEEFFTAPDPAIGYFFDTPDDAASFGNLNNKNIGSEEGIKNSQRFVDYFNTFPEYYVAMSRNFGSFTMPDGSGGNFNPAIPSDTTPMGNAPPAYWDKDSATPWFTDSKDPNATPFYIPPAPNAPAESVNFSTPFDPTVLQISSFDYTGSDDSSEQRAFLKNLNDLQSFLGSANGVTSSLLLKDQGANDGKLSYVIQTTYSTYSALHALKKSTSFTESMQAVLDESDMSTVNHTVNSDVRAKENQQFLVGKAKVAPGNMEQALALSKELGEEVIARGYVLSSEYYIDENDPNTIVYLEYFESGANTNEYLVSDAYSKFTAELGPLLETGLLASRNVGIYPVNDSISQFYPEQLNGMDQLTSILESMPDLKMSLTVDNGYLKPTNETFTSEVGGYLKAKSSSLVNNDSGRIVYGYIDPSSNSPVVLFEQTKQMDDLDFIKTVNERMIPYVSGDKFQLFADRTYSAEEIHENGVSYNTLFSNSDNFTIDGNTAKFLGLEISLDTAVQGFSQVSSSAQMNQNGLVDLSQAPRRVLSGEFHLFDANGTHLDNNNVGFGLYKQETSDGGISDPLTGQIISPSDNSLYEDTVRYLENNNLLAKASMSDHKGYSIDGGYEYLPYLIVDNEIYTVFEESFIQLGENSFGFETSDGIYIASLDLLTSGNVPLLS